MTPEVMNATEEAKKHAANIKRVVSQASFPAITPEQLETLVEGMCMVMYRTGVIDGIDKACKKLV